MLFYDGAHEGDKINISQLKYSFTGNSQFEPNLAQYKYINNIQKQYIYECSMNVFTTGYL